VLEMVGRERKGYNRLSISRLCNVLLEVGHRNRADVQVKVRQEL
jgi:hypothetical protein